MEFFPKETQAHRYRKGTFGNQENQDAVDWKGENKQTTHKTVILLLFKL